MMIIVRFFEEIKFYKQFNNHRNKITSALCNK